MSERLLSIGEEILIIGKNGSGQFGIGYSRSVQTLTHLNEYHSDKSITNIYLGHLYTICSDKNHTNIWVAGNNDYGECAVETKINESINTLNKIDYFDNHDMKIRQIFTRFTGARTYWITNNNEVYGNGKGMSDKPELISCLQNAVDIQSADKYAIALCSTDKNIAAFILQYWSRSLFIDNIPNDIMELIIIFYHINSVFATNGFGNDDYSKDINEEYDSDKELEQINDQTKWKEIEILMDKNIIKISTGRRHSLFLDSNGNVWNCCESQYGDLGIIDVDYGNIPSLIEYFVEKGIKIRDIACGGYHNLAVDINNKLYSWGYNDDAECGVGDRDLVEKPTLILKDQQIECITCGFWHSYCRTVDGKHYLFGENDHMQCILEESANLYGVVMEPQCINGTIEEKFPGKRIKSVLLGNDSTVVILEQELV